MAYVEIGESRTFKSALVSQLNGNPTLCKDRLTHIKVGILYMKTKLLTVENHNTELNLGCDCGVCFLNMPEARIVQNRGRPKTLAPIKVWFAGRGLYDV